MEAEFIEVSVSPLARLLKDQTTLGSLSIELQTISTILSHFRTALGQAAPKPLSLTPSKNSKKMSHHPETERNITSEIYDVFTNKHSKSVIIRALTSYKI